MLNGCFLLPALVPVWRMFSRLSRGRDYLSSSGEPMPLKYRDIRDAADRCICELPTDVIEDLLTILDDAVLEAARGRRNDHHSRND